MSETIEYNEIFDLAFRFATETKENIFLTGKAGTGKTTFLKYLKEHCVKNIIVAAPTGVAALNAGGVTLHSLFQLPFHPFLPTKASKDELLKKLKYTNTRISLLRKLDLLVIDEISMVRCDVMDAIDTILRWVYRNYEQPFGGVQLLCIGDLYQLPPVARNQEWALLQEFYESPFFFDSLSIKEQNPLLIELNKIYRQKEGSFVRLLNKVRNNDLHEDDFEDLLLRYQPNFRPPEEENYITLTSHNKQADDINAKALLNLIRPSHFYQAEISGDFNEQLYPAEPNLELKVGAQVMFLKNDGPLKRYFNGKIGIVKQLNEEEIVVECNDIEIIVQKEDWENTRYILNKETGKLDEEILGSFTQFPLRLAWAITIHKSQGLTFDKVMIDAGAAFSSGQVYVALSRCTSLEGIVLLSKITPAAIHSNQAVIDGQQKLAHKGSLAERFEGARQIYILQILEELFNFKQPLQLIQKLAELIKNQLPKLTSNQQQTTLSNWVQNLVQQLNNDNHHAINFLKQLTALSKEESRIEDNAPMQKRITDASNYFAPRLAGYVQAILKNPLLTEYKETATLLNDSLQNLFLILHRQLHQMQFGKNNFVLKNWLQHCIKYLEPKQKLNIYANAKEENTDAANASELLSTLKRWRSMVCEESDLPIYMVAHQASLAEIALYLPFTKNDLTHITGFGKAKAEKYGDDILEIVLDYCERCGLESNMANMPAQHKKVTSKNKEPKTPSRNISLNLLNKGYSLEAIAQERNITVDTVLGHLSFFVNSGTLELEKIMDAEKIKHIKNAIHKSGSKELTDILKLLPAGYSYADVRTIRTVMQTLEN